MYVFRAEIVFFQPRESPGHASGPVQSRHGVIYCSDVFPNAEVGMGQKQPYVQAVVVVVLRLGVRVKTRSTRE